MVKAKLGKEVVVKVSNEIGILSQICKVVSEKGVNILAVHASVEGTTATMRFVTSDNLRIGDALRAKSYAPREADCVLVELPHKPGVLRGITEKLAAENIDIHHLYATAIEADGRCLVAFSCSNNDRAVVALNR